MVQSARLEAWNHTSAVLALIANVNRDAKKRPRPFEPVDFNPVADKKAKKRQGIPMDRAGMELMKGMFTGEKGI